MSSESPIIIVVAETAKRYKSNGRKTVANKSPRAPKTTMVLSCVFSVVLPLFFRCSSRSRDDRCGSDFAGCLRGSGAAKIRCKYDKFGRGFLCNKKNLLSLFLLFVAEGISFFLYVEFYMYWHLHYARLDNILGIRIFDIKKLFAPGATRWLFTFWLLTLNK